MYYHYSKWMLFIKPATIIEISLLARGGGCGIVWVIHIREATNMSKFM